MMLPVEQSCPKCGRFFLGSDILGHPCLDCQDERPLDWAGPYVLEIKDLMIFTIMVPGLPDWEESENVYETLTNLICQTTGALPSELRGG